MVKYSLSPRKIPMGFLFVLVLVLLSAQVEGFNVSNIKDLNSLNGF